MAQSGVGRLPRTASRLAFASPIGHPALPLVSIQAAGERGAVRTGLGAGSWRGFVARLGIRTLVVAGFAGAAWLLSANAAQAAEVPATDPTLDLSVVDVLTGSGNGAASGGPAADGSTSAVPTTATAALATAHQPVLGGPSELFPGAVAPVGKTPSGTVMPAGGATSVVLPGAAATRMTSLGVPRAGTTGDGHAASNAAAGADLTRLANEAVPGLTGAAGPTAGLATLTRTIASVTGTLRTAAAPVTVALNAVTEPIVDAIAAPVLDAVAAPTVHAVVAPVVSVLPRVGETRTSAVDGPSARALASVPVERDRAVAAVEGGAGRSAADNQIQSAVRSLTGERLRPAEITAGRAGTGEVPGRPGPAPSRGYLGLGAGVPANGSGSLAEGGGYAVVPASVAGSAAQVRRLPVPADVVVARQEAESPTVSPD
jgi:hypothetical protein